MKSHIIKYNKNRLCNKTLKLIIKKKQSENAFE